ncbi:MAG: NUDIX domain-containing protein [Verrucomicrobiales bacterium]|nr:NUDIX domain-containing protein [Verrucomicrobiales bacterium]
MDLFRPNVAAILRKRKTGLILICQRKDHTNSWQFPQGGVDEGEDLIAALYREVKEEVGIPSRQYTLRSCRTGYRYTFPDGHLKKGQFRGQEQTYFLCDYRGKKSDIILDGQEFIRYKWIEPKEFDISWVPDFKKPVFRQLFHDFFRINLTSEPDY